MAKQLADNSKCEERCASADTGVGVTQIMNADVL